MALSSKINASMVRFNELKNQVFEYCKENKETIIKIAKIVGISMVAIGTMAVMASFGIGTTTFLFSKVLVPGGVALIFFLMIMFSLISGVFYGISVLEAVKHLLCSANYIIFSNPIFYITITAILVTSIAITILGIVVLKVSLKHENEVLNTSKEIEIKEEINE